MSLELGRLLGKHWAASTLSLLWKVAHFFVSANQNIIHWERKAALAIQGTRVHKRSLRLLTFAKSAGNGRSRWVRAPNYQGQQSSSGKSDAAKGCAARSCPWAGHQLISAPLPSPRAHSLWHPCLLKFCLLSLPFTSLLNPVLLKSVLTDSVPRLHWLLTH